MGLDMYAFATDEAPEREADFEASKDSAQFFYWRKHPKLHGWMERLYRQKGGQDPDFNCVNLLLTSADLDQLETDILFNGLPVTTGFFFGESLAGENEGDLIFIHKARDLISEGNSVFYTSWW